MDRGKQIDKARKDAIDINTDALETAAYSVIVDALYNNFELKKGIIVVDKSFGKRLNSFVNDVLGDLRVNPSFTGEVAGFIKNIPVIHDAIQQFQISQGIDAALDGNAEKIVTEEFKNQLLREGLNQNFIQPIRDLLYQQGLSGLTIDEAKGFIKQYVMSGRDMSGKLQSYVQSTAQQAVDAYSGLVNMKLMEQFDYDAWLITGSLIDTSSPQCRYAIEELGGVITRKDWPKLKKIAERHGLIEGTTFENLSVLQLHWGCRHGFYSYVNKKAA
jgi:hypothetical protein